MSSRVLVADDSSTMRKIILRSLQAVGVTEVTEAGDGDEAIAKFQPGQFDMVLTDWNMPGKTGLEVVQDIRGRDAKIPIIMVTTEAEKSRVHAGHSSRRFRLPRQALHRRHAPRKTHQARLHLKTRPKDSVRFQKHTTRGIISRGFFIGIELECPALNMPDRRDNPRRGWKLRRSRIPKRTSRRRLQIRCEPRSRPPGSPSFHEGLPAGRRGCATCVRRSWEP